MHFALPPRKSSQPPPYARSPRWNAHPQQKRQQMKLGAAVFCAVLLAFYFLLRIFSSAADAPERIPPGTPEVVLVTVLDDTMSERYVARMKENREDYAARHGELELCSAGAALVLGASRLTRVGYCRAGTGYKTVYPKASEYDLEGSPRSWALVPALRHAMTLNPHSNFFFHLSAHSLIMNPTLSLTAHVMAQPRLESLMLKDKPVVPPDSVIHTFSHLRGDKIDLVLTQDGEGLCQESFVLRRGEWARFFLDVWFDPLYRSYNFQKAEGHALVRVDRLSQRELLGLMFLARRSTSCSGTRPSSPSWR